MYLKMVGNMFLEDFIELMAFPKTFDVFANISECVGHIINQLDLGATICLTSYKLNISLLGIRIAIYARNIVIWPVILIV